MIEYMQGGGGKFRGTSLMRNSHLPRIAIEPCAEACCRFLDSRPMSRALWWS